jgi:hypothetical protein
MVLMFAAGATGVMLGLWFRVQALIAASAATVLSFLLIAAFTDFGVLAAAGTLLLLLSLLQAGYLAGLMARMRGRAPALRAPDMITSRGPWLGHSIPARGRANRNSFPGKTQLASPRLRVSAARSSQMVQRRA